MHQITPKIFEFYQKKNLQLDYNHRTSRGCARDIKHYFCFLRQRHWSLNFRTTYYDLGPIMALAGHEYTTETITKLKKNCKYNLQNRQNK